MVYQVPTDIPPSARAGDTLQWTRSLADYPASVWILTYTLFNSAAKETIVAAADGDDYSIAVAPAVTALFAVGEYDWAAHVSDGIDRHQVDSGRIDILPDLAVVSLYDGRSHARTMLEAIESLLEGRATDGDLDVVRASYGDVSTEHDRELLMRLRAQYAAAVKAEDDALAAARGERTGFIQMRF